MPINWGLLNPNIPAQVADSYNQGQDNALKRAMMQQQQEQGQYALSKARRDDEIQNGLLSALQNAKPEDIPGIYTRYGKGKEAVEMQKGQADIALNKAKAANYKIDLAGQAAGYVSDNPTVENAHRVLDYLGANEVFTPEQVAQYKQQTLQNPGQIKQMADMLRQSALSAKDQLAKTQMVNIGGSTLGLSTNPVTNQTTQNFSIQNTQSPDSAAAGERAQNATGKAPPGYAWGPAGADGNPTMIAVKGGPADYKQQGVFNQDTAALQGSTSSMDRLAAAANEVLKHPGLKSIYGLRGVIPNVPGTDAADAAALLNTLKSQVGFGVLQDMRNNSKTGGALGAVSDKENAMLQANLAALEKAQSFEQAQKSLEKIVAYADEAKGRLRGAFNMKHGEQTNQVPSGGARLIGGIDPAAVIRAESGGNQSAVSPKGAAGTMQLMPATAKGLGVNPNDRLENVAGGVAMLGQLRQKYGNDQIALAAYNWGPGNVDRWLKEGGDPAKLPAETRNYIATVMAHSKAAQQTKGNRQANNDIHSQAEAILRGN